MTSTGAFHRTRSRDDDAPSIRKRGRNQKIFNPGPLGEDVSIYNGSSTSSSSSRMQPSRGKSIESMRRRQRSFDDYEYDTRRKRGTTRSYEELRAARKREYDYDEEVPLHELEHEHVRATRKRDYEEEEEVPLHEHVRATRKRDYEDEVPLHELEHEHVRAARKRDDEDEEIPLRAAARKRDYEDEEPPLRKRKTAAPAGPREVIDVDVDTIEVAPKRRAYAEPRWKRDYEDEGARYDSEASRVFPGYSGRRSPPVSSFTNKPTGTFPAVASTSLRRAPLRDEEASDEDDDYGGYEHCKLATRRNNRYEDDYDELEYRRSRPVPRHRRRPLEPDYPDYEAPSHRRSDSLEEEEYYTRSRYQPSLYAPDERRAARGHRRGVVATAREPISKPRVPETVSIISNDSRGSERASPVEKTVTPGKPHKKKPLQLPQSIDEGRSSFRPPLDQPILLEQVPTKQRYVLEERRKAMEEKPWDGHCDEPMYPTFDFCVGDVESHVDYHIMVMTAQDHERNPMVTKLMMDDHVYTAYPFKRRELLKYAQLGDLEPIAKAVAQMFQKFRKEIHVRVEFIGHHQFVEGRSISLVVGTVESEPATPKRPVKETSVVTVVGGTFKGGRGVVRVIRDDKVLLVMVDNGNQVLRWTDLNCVELMDENRLLNQLAPPKPQTHHHHRITNQREVDTLLLNPSCSMDSEMMSALQNDLFIDGSPESDGQSEAARHDVRTDDFMDKDRTPLRGRKNSSDARDFLADIEDHLSASFDPDLYHMMDSDKLGTPRPYDDGPSFFSPLLRDPRYVDEVDKFGSRPSSAVPTNSPAPAQEAKEAANASTAPSVPSLKRDDENGATQVRRTLAAAGALQQPKLGAQENSVGRSRRPNVAKTHLEDEEDLKPAAVEQEDVEPSPDSVLKPDSPEYAPIAPASVDDIAADAEEQRRPPKKRKSVPAMDLLDRRSSRTNSEVEDSLRLPPLPPIDDDDDDIPPSTQEKIYVNGINESSAGCRQSSPDLNGVSLDDGSSVHEEERGAKPVVKRGRGRPKKCRHRDTSSAYSFLHSMSVLELRDKLRRMKLPTSGNRTKLCYSLTQALMVDKETPIEVLPDVITRFTPL
jgi:hypothetical protein